MSAVIESSNVIRLILQFLRESNLTQTLNTLTEESGVYPNTVDSVESFLSNVSQGHWDKVILSLKSVKLSDSKLMDLYEHVAIELVELREFAAVKSLLRQADPLLMLKTRCPERYERIESMMGHPVFDQRIYGESREKRRAQIGESLVKDIVVVPPSRLLTLLGQSLKWQKQEGLLPPGDTIDIFLGRSSVEAEEESFPKENSTTIKFGQKSHAKVGAFSPDGQHLVTGTVDGFIEVWNFTTGKLRKDLPYQEEDNFMMMEDSVMSLAFSKDLQTLAAGSSAGQIKVFRLSTGQCVRRVGSAHSGAVNGLTFSRDSSQVLSCSNDCSMRIHGMKSSRLLKEFVGHDSYVNCAVYISDAQVVSGSADSTIKVWSLKTCECLNTFRTFGGTLGNAAVLSLCPFKSSPKFVVCNQSNLLYVMDPTGQVTRTFTSDVPLVGCVLSPQNKLLYGLGEDKALYCFSVEEGRLERTILVGGGQPLGICHHPLVNLVGTYCTHGLVKLWKT